MPLIQGLGRIGNVQMGRRQRWKHLLFDAIQINSGGSVVVERGNRYWFGVAQISGWTVRRHGFQKLMERAEVVLGVVVGGKGIES